MPGLRATARAVVVPYVVSRLLVLGSLGLVRHVFTTLQVAAPLQAHQGLFAWDAAWYRDITAGGYDAVAKSGLRFFPLVPLVARAVAVVPGVDAGLGLLLVSNLCALAAGVVLYRLVRWERDDEALARRAVWIVFLAPPAFVLVMGYAEATLLLCAAVALYALRRRQWWVAVVAGFLGGLARPVGVLLVVAAAVEAWQAARATPEARRVTALVGEVAASVAPLAGAFSYLLWVRARTGSLLYPLRAQEDPKLRGGWVDPVRGFAHGVHEAFSGDHVSAGVHIVAACILIALVGVLARRWPLSYTLFAAATLLVGLSSRNLDSLERYSLSTIPFVVAAADVVSTERREQLVFALLGAGLVAAAILAFTGVMVP